MDDERQATIRQHLNKFVSGRRLVLPLEKMRMSFNPNELIPLGEVGTVYPTLSITDTWGVLKVTGGAMISSDFSRVVVSVPADYSNALKTSQWKVDLNGGWSIYQQADDVFSIRESPDRTK